MKNRIHKILLGLCASLTTGIATARPSDVFFQNNTPFNLSAQAASPLSTSYWGRGATSLPAYAKDPVKILGFNRNTGIKRGKQYEFTTTITLPIKNKQTSANATITLKQRLKGTWNNSNMWQGSSLSAAWHGDNKQYLEVFKFVDTNNKKYTFLLSYNSYLDEDLFDDIQYNLSYIPEIEKAPTANTLNVLAWNVYMRPSALFLNGQNQRAGLIPLVISKDFDVLIFSEAFDTDARAKLVRGLAQQGFVYATDVVGHAGSRLKMNGGVIIVSKWPIEVNQEKMFGSTCSKDDCLADKGIVYAKINKQGKRYHIFGTHTQAWPTPAGRSTRVAQFRMLQSFIQSLPIPNTEPVIIAGDLNVDSVKNVAGEREKMLAASHTIEPTRQGPQKYTADRTTNDLTEGDPEYLDYVLYSADHQQPQRSYNKVLIYKSPYEWKPSPAHESVLELSDHYGLYGYFEF